jgi:hypothetical protein
MGKMDTNVESAPVILPALQHQSIISVVIGDYHNAALTSDGALLTWGQYSNGALGLGDPGRLKPGTPGGFEVQERRGVTYHPRRRPPAVSVPTEVRFSNSRKKANDMFCFAAAAAGWHTGALVIDLNVRTSHISDMFLRSVNVQPDVKDIDIREEDDVEAVDAEPPQPLPPSTPPFWMGGPGEVPAIPALGGSLLNFFFGGGNDNH